MPQTLEATFRIVTPMFIGGADQDISDGIRPPSIKGALRFWWRALNWGRYRAESSCDEAALAMLHQAEARLFGASAEQGGQGKFLVRISRQASTGNSVRDWPGNAPNKNQGARYMAFGIFESGNRSEGNYKPHREAIKEDQDFDVRITFKRDASHDDTENINTALHALGLFGGLGSRSRRGNGALSLRTINGIAQVLSRDEIESNAKHLIANYSKVDTPPITALSKDTHFRMLTEGKDARAALESAGLMYKNARGQASNLRGASKIPFGLPLQGVDEKNRRSSPLLFHVHAMNNGRFATTLLFMPARPFHHAYPDLSFTDVARFAHGGAS